MAMNNNNNNSNKSRLERFREAQETKTTGHGKLKKFKGKWVSVLCIGTIVLGLGFSLTNDTVMASVNSAAVTVMKTVNSTDFDEKDTYMADETISSESSKALGAITAKWSDNDVETIRAEIERQREAGLSVYVIQWGDTLSVLAEALGVTVDDLAATNNIGNKDLILAGDLLLGVLNTDAIVAAQEKGDGEVEKEKAAESTEKVDETVKESEKDSEKPDANDITPDEPVQNDNDDSMTILPVTPEDEDAVVAEPVDKDTDEDVNEEPVDETPAPDEDKPVEEVPDANEPVEETPDTDAPVLDPEEDEDTVVVEPEDEEDLNPILTTIEETEREEIPFETEIVEDPGMNPGEEVVFQSGSVGLMDKVYNVSTYKDGTTKRDFVEDRVVQEPVKQIVYVGVDKTADNNEDSIVEYEEERITWIDYETTIIEDPNLPVGYEEIETYGETGQKIDVYMITETNGEVTGEKFLRTSTTQPINEVIRKGTMDVSGDTITTDIVKVREVIPAGDTYYIETDELAPGEEEVVQEGKDGVGEASYLVTYRNGKEVSRVLEGRSMIEEPLQRIVRIGLD